MTTATRSVTARLSNSGFMNPPWKKQRPFYLLAIAPANENRGRLPARLAVHLMKPTLLFIMTLVCGLMLPCAAAPQSSDSPSLATPQEKHLHNVRQLTFGGQNAEAYFSADGKQLIFQSTRDDVKCDQMFIMNLDGSNVHMVSTGKGRTTCGYFYRSGKKIL